MAIEYLHYTLIDAHSILTISSILKTWTWKLYIKYYDTKTEYLDCKTENKIHVFSHCIGDVIQNVLLYNT